MNKKAARFLKRCLDQSIYNDDRVYTLESWNAAMSNMYVDWHPITECEKRVLLGLPAKKDDPRFRDEDCCPLQFYRYIKLFKVREPDRLMWISIRPQIYSNKTNSQDFEIFKTFVDKFLKSTCITEYYAAYEIKPNGMGNGLHVHIICDGEINRINGKCMKIRKGTTYKKMGKMAVDFTTVPKEWFQEKIDYVNGNTMLDEKNEQKKVNPSWRLENKMPNTYNLKNPENYNLYI